MELIDDAAGYSTDLRLRGFAIISLATVLLIVIPTYLLAAPPDFLSHERPAIFLAAGGALIVLCTLALVLKGKGMLFKIPLKFYDEAMLIQPVLGMRPVIIPYKEIASLELWHGLGYKRVGSGCYVLSSRNSVTSVEVFKDKQSLMAFLGKIRPALEKSGLRMSPPDEEAGSLHCTFHRDVGRRRPRGEAASPWAPL